MMQCHLCKVNNFRRRKEKIILNPKPAFQSIMKIFVDIVLNVIQEMFEPQKEKLKSFYERIQQIRRYL